MVRRSLPARRILWPNTMMEHAAIQTSTAYTNLPVGTKQPPFLPSPAPWCSTWEDLLGPTALVVAAEGTHASGGGRLTLTQGKLPDRVCVCHLSSLGMPWRVSKRVFPTLTRYDLCSSGSSLVWHPVGYSPNHLAMILFSHHWSPADLVSIYC